MSDYSFDVDVLRGKMAQQLANNHEQFIFVITNALENVDVVEVVDYGQLGDEADPETIIISLRFIADAIERGDLS